MTGKEALDDYKDFGKIKGESITSNQTFVPSRFHNEWRQKYFEEIEDVNLRADMVCARNDELENKLSKYERAFEILKRNTTITLDKGKHEEEQIYCINIEQDYNQYVLFGLSKEEYELLEELMQNENC